MALDGSLLGDEIASAMGYSPASAQIIAFGNGVVDELKMGIATFGNVPSPHSISGLVGSRMASAIMTNAGYPSVTPELIGFCNAMTSYIMTNAIVTYSGPPPSPPVIMPPAAWFLGGTISGLDGSACANEVKTSCGYPSVSTQLLAECTAIVNHIMTNAQVVSGVIS